MGDGEVGVGEVGGVGVGGDVRGLLPLAVGVPVPESSLGRRLGAVVQATGGSGLDVTGGVGHELVGVADGLAGAGAKLLARTGTAAAVPPTRNMPASRMVYTLRRNRLISLCGCPTGQGQASKAAAKNDGGRPLGELCVAGNEPSRVRGDSAEMRRRPR